MVSKSKINNLLFYTNFAYYKRYRVNELNTNFKVGYTGFILENIEELLFEMEKRSLSQLDIMLVVYI